MNKSIYCKLKSKVLEVMLQSRFQTIATYLNVSFFSSIYPQYLLRLEYGYSLHRMTLHRPMNITLPHKPPRTMSLLPSPEHNWYVTSTKDKYYIALQDILGRDAAGLLNRSHEPPPLQTIFQQRTVIRALMRRLISSTAEKFSGGAVWSAFVRLCRCVLFFAPL